jgi:hypothetical protein
MMRFFGSAVLLVAVAAAFCAWLRPESILSLMLLTSFCQ